MLTPTSLELDSARVAKPLYPKKWSEISTITISYGHGLSASPVHLAAAYASLLNGGLKVEPSLIKGGRTIEKTRVVSEEISDNLRTILRKVVTEGTGSFADVEGYQVGGKTGTADKPKRTGGYYSDKVIANFAAVFPASAPEYVLVVILDEPEDVMLGKTRRSAGWTAAPIAGEIIRRVAPVLGLRPLTGEAQPGQSRVTLASQ